MKILRGSSLFSTRRLLDSSCRCYNGPNELDDDCGFRVASRKGGKQILRGGSWINLGHRCADRYPKIMKAQTENRSFRVARRRA